MQEGWETALAERYEGMPAEERRREAEYFAALSKRLRRQARVFEDPGMGEIRKEIWRAAVMADERARLAAPGESE